MAECGVWKGKFINRHLEEIIQYQKNILQVVFKGKLKFNLSINRKLF